MMVAGSLEVASFEVFDSLGAGCHDPPHCYDITILNHDYPELGMGRRSIDHGPSLYSRPSLSTGKAGNDIAHTNCGHVTVYLNLSLSLDLARHLTIA